MRTHTCVMILMTLMLLGCKPPKEEKTPELNLELSKQIDMMANRDKQMQINMLQFAYSSPEELQEVEKLRDQVYQKHAESIKEILNNHGYPGFDLVGKQSVDNFFVLMQHLDDYPNVMRLGLENMENALVKNQVEAYQYVVLSDQLAKVVNEPQPFGTIVQFDENGKAYVDKRAKNIETNRAEMGMDSLNRYLDVKSMEYFKLNREELSKRGIDKPALNYTYK